MSEECEICWDTGFFHGHGGPCSRGCKPTDHQHGIRKAWTPNESPKQPESLGITTPTVLSILDSTFDHTDALQDIVDRACAGEEVTILWPPFDYEVFVQMSFKDRGEIQFRYRGSRMTGVNYVIEITAELEVTPHKTSDPTTHNGVILRLKGMPTKSKDEDWIKSGAFVEGRGRWSGKIARIVNVDHATSDIIVEVRYVDSYGKDGGDDYFHLSDFSHCFDHRPNWAPRVRTTPFQQPSPQMPPINPLQVHLTLTGTPSRSVVDVTDRTGRTRVGWRFPNGILYLLRAGTVLDITVTCAGYKTLMLGNITVPEKDFELPAKLELLTPPINPFGFRFDLARPFSKSWTKCRNMF